MTLNLSTLDDVKKIEEESAIVENSDLNIKYSYEIDNYNRYDANYYLKDGKIDMISVNYYSYDMDGAKAFQNGKDLYDKLFSDFKAKYGEAQKYAEDNYFWNTKSAEVVNMKVQLMNTGQEGSSGTVQILFSVQ